MVYKRCSRQSLRLNVSNILFGLDVLDLKNLLGNQISNVVIADVNVFATLIMHVVLSEICSTNVVLIHGDRHLNSGEGLGKNLIAQLVVLFDLDIVGLWFDPRWGHRDCIDFQQGVLTEPLAVRIYGHVGPYQIGGRR